MRIKNYLLILSLLTMARAAYGEEAISRFTYHLDRPQQISVGVYDSQGVIVRTLLSGEKSDTGAHSASWDRLDRHGQPVPPGKYEWRMFANEGLKAEFLLGVGTSMDWPAYEEWIGNHDGPRSVAVDAAGNVYAGAGSGENAAILLKMSADWKRKLWAIGELEIALGAERLAIIGETLFVMTQSKGVFALKTADGGNLRGHAQRFYSALHESDVAWTWQNKDDKSLKFHVSHMDLEAVGTQLAFCYRDYDLLRFVSALDASVTREVKIARPGGLAAGPDGRLFIAAEGKILALDPGAEQTRVVVEDAELKSPVGMTWEPVSGDLLVALDGEGAKHIRRYHDGKLIGTLGRKAGRQLGAFDSRDFGNLCDVQADGKGGFFTIESVLRRLVHFSSDSTTPDREWFGGVQWGAMMCVDPEDPTIAFFEVQDRQFLRAKLDLAARRWTLTHVYERLPHLQPTHELGRRWRVMRRGGRMYLVGYGEDGWRHAPYVIEVLDDGARLRLASFLTRFYANENDGIEGLKEANQRAGLPHAQGVSWTDANGDGQFQSEEMRPASQTPGGGHVWLDRDWNVFVAGTDHQKRDPNLKGRAVMWFKIANRATRAEDLPTWDWNDAQAIHAEVPAEIERWGFPGMAGIAVDDDGSVYQVTDKTTYRVGTTPQERELKEERHGNGWPHSYSATARLFKWKPDGSLAWASGKKANEKTAERPGELACPIGFLGFAGDKLFVQDRTGLICQAWTKDGLYAGYVFDRHADDGLPAETIYRVIGDVSPKNFLMGDDHRFQNFTLAADGHVYWAESGHDAIALFRVHDWQGGSRRTGTIEINSAATAAKHLGTGLKAEFFASPDLSGSSAATRVDDQVWFGGAHLAFINAMKAPPFFVKESPVPERTFSARWTGEVEPRFSEDYRFGVYVQGDRGGPKGEIIGSKARLWIDNQPVLDHWNGVEPETRDLPRTYSLLSGPIKLKAGQRVAIRLEFAANHGPPPQVHLVWESRTQDREHILASALYPTAHN